MSVAGGPDMIQDGLVLAVNAADRNSYPGSGTTWIDLSGNNTNGTLNNSPTFSNLSGGIFSFDGTDDWVNFPNSTALNSNTITVSSTFNPSSVAQNGFLFEKGYVNTQYALFFEGVNLKLRFIFTSIGQRDFQIVASDYMSINNWYNCAVTYDGSVARMYLNGVNILTTTYNSDIAVNNNGERIGAWYNGVVNGYYFLGKIASTQIYNRALTASEVAQNYSATKTRFGL